MIANGLSAVTALFSAALMLASMALAGKAYDEAAFTAAQSAGKPILVEVHAEWCPTCRAQKSVIEGLAASPEYKDLVAFEVDFDGQKTALRKFGAQQQSTLIVFRGDREVARSVGETSPAAIEALVKSAYKG